jgi:soluble lytic murein transglycosylase-like protein
MRASSIGRRAALGLLLGGLVACGRRPEPAAVAAAAPVTGLHRGETPQMRALINRYAAIHGIPPELLHRVIQRESGYNPGARNGPYYGLMQIHPQTARTMGFQGAPEQLLNPEVNLQYAGRYLRGAYIVANGDLDAAVRWYARGYYYEARNRGLLVETGLASRERI